MLTDDYLKTAVSVLQSRSITLAPGLTDSEVEMAEAIHGFRFPPDLRALLQHALPVGKSFPNWRLPDSPFIHGMLAWPADGICFDIEHDAFWMSEWGERPPGLADAQLIARRAVRSAPFLAPVYGHRYIPASPCRAGNPIFSVYQTDIIYYGLDLMSYFEAEFGIPNPAPLPDAPREIAFWSALERLNG